MKWWLICMNKYFDFSGRASRTEYWMFNLFNLIFYLLAVTVPSILGFKPEDQPLVYLLPMLYFFAVLIPSFAVLVRRLHDVDKSAWWVFIRFLPFIGNIWLFILTVTESYPGENQYGLNPQYEAEFEVI